MKHKLNTRTLISNNSENEKVPEIDWKQKLKRDLVMACLESNCLVWMSCLQIFGFIGKFLFVTVWEISQTFTCYNRKSESKFTIELVLHRNSFHRNSICLE